MPCASSDRRPGARGPSHEGGSAGAGQRGKGGRSRSTATWAMSPVDVLKVLAAPAVRRDQVRLDGPGRMGTGCQGDRVHLAHRLGLSWPRWPYKNGRASCLLSAVRPLSVTKVYRIARGEVTRRELVVGVDDRGSGDVVGLSVTLSGTTLSRLRWPRFRASSTHPCELDVGATADSQETPGHQQPRRRATRLPRWRQGRLRKTRELS